MNILCSIGLHDYHAEILTDVLCIYTPSVQAYMHHNRLLKYTCRKCKKIIYKFDSKDRLYYTHKELKTRCLDVLHHSSLYLKDIKNTTISYETFVKLKNPSVFKLVEIDSDNECEKLYKCVLTGLCVSVDNHDWICPSPSKHIFRVESIRRNHYTGDNMSALSFTFRKYPEIDMLDHLDKISYNYLNIHSNKPAGIHVCLKCKKIHSDYENPLLKATIRRHLSSVISKKQKIKDMKPIEYDKSDQITAERIKQAQIILDEHKDT